MASHQITVVGAPGTAPVRVTAYRAPPSTNDTAGPARATRISAGPRGKKPSNQATPPNSHSVMLWIFIPSRRAWMACPNSWARIETANTMAAAAAIAR